MLRIPGQPIRIRARIDTSDKIAAGDPDNEDGCSTAYGWVQVRPLPGGCWEDMPSSEGGLSGEADTEPAYEANGVLVGSDTYVWLERGAPVIVSNSPDPDTVKMIWLFDVGTSTSEWQQCRVAGSPTTIDGIDFYPAYTQEIDPDGTSSGVMGFLDVTAVALCQYWNFALTTTGSGGCYTGRRHARIESVELGGNPYPVYVTTEYPTLGADCTIVN